MKNIFQKIIDNELPAEKVFENERILAIKDIAPAAPVHILLITKKAIPSISEATSEDNALIAELIQTANTLAKEQNLTDYRLIFNNGKEAGQTIFQLHLHLIGGKTLGSMA